MATATLLQATTNNTPASQNIRTSDGWQQDDACLVIAGALATGSTCGFTLINGDHGQKLEGVAAGQGVTLTLTDCEKANDDGTRFVSIWIARIDVLVGGSGEGWTAAPVYAGTGVRRSEIWRLRPGSGLKFPARSSRLLAYALLTGGNSGGGAIDSFNMSAGPGIGEILEIIAYYTASSMASSPTADADNASAPTAFELTADANSSGVGAFVHAYAAADTQRPNATSPFTQRVTWVSNPGSGGKALVAVVLTLEQPTAAFSDTAHCTATLSAQATHPQAFADTAGCTDTLVAGAGQAATFTNTAGCTATLATHLAAVGTLTDTAGCTDDLNVDTTGQASAAFADTAHCTATLLANVSRHASFSDTAHCTATLGVLTTSGTTPPTGGDEWYEGGTPGARTSAGADTAGCTAVLTVHQTTARAFSEVAHCTATLLATGRVGAAFADPAHATAALAVHQTKARAFSDVARCTAVFVAHRATIAALDDTAGATATLSINRTQTRPFSGLAHCTATLAVSVESHGTAVTLPNQAGATATISIHLDTGTFFADTASSTATFSTGTLVFLTGLAGCTATLSTVTVATILRDIRFTAGAPALRVAAGAPVRSI